MRREFELKFIETSAEMDEALSVRRAVFIEEQSVPEDVEIDEHDGPPERVRTALHVLGRLDGLAVATGRLVIDPDREHPAHVGRVAVLEAHRGNGYGREVMLKLQAKAQELGYPGVVLSAQLHAVGFYERLGYRAHGDVYLEAGIEHLEMDLWFE
jgi:predicted GNAT family N-acyltransferase